MQKKIALLLVTLTAIFWGTNFIVSKSILEHLSPIIAAALRFSLAAVLLLPIILYSESLNKIKEAIKQNLSVYLFLGIVGVAGFNGLFFLGIKYTTPINGALIMGTNPLVTLLLSVIFLKEPIYKNQRIGVLFSLMGVLVVITNGTLQQLLHLHIAFGDWIIMGSNLCWAVYGVVGKRYLKSSKPLVTTTVTMIIGALTLILLALPELNMAQLWDQSKQICGGLMYVVIFGTVLAYLFWNYGLTHLGASNTAVFFNLVPLVTVSHALILGQSISSVQIWGGLAVIFGVLVSTNIIKVPYLKENGRSNEPLEVAG
ncbi:MAG: EamA family transporter [Legionellaceae bacterium]|nr:EamA family transporter [Legionellaceae bacterium]